ncbi:MAG: hypothetical protein KBH92_07935, partial [Syntrophaceae bacterium]|nr:hypothetical protein [Syntrophaceae bacterium]
AENRYEGNDRNEDLFAFRSHVPSADKKFVRHQALSCREAVNLDGFVKSQFRTLFVISAKAGIQ